MPAYPTPKPKQTPTKHPREKRLQAEPKVNPPRPGPPPIPQWQPPYNPHAPKKRPITSGARPNATAMANPQTQPPTQRVNPQLQDGFIPPLQPWKETPSLERYARTIVKQILQDGELTKENIFIDAGTVELPAPETFNSTYFWAKEKLPPTQRFNPGQLVKMIIERGNELERDGVITELLLQVVPEWWPKPDKTWKELVVAIKESLQSGACGYETRAGNRIWRIEAIRSMGLQILTGLFLPWYIEAKEGPPKVLRREVKAGKEKLRSLRLHPQCLLRDGYQCAITNTFHPAASNVFGLLPPEAINVTFSDLETIHILPPGLCSLIASSPTDRTTKHPGPSDIVEMMNPRVTYLVRRRHPIGSPGTTEHATLTSATTSIGLPDCPSNAITLTSNLGELFSTFKIALRRIEGCNGRPEMEKYIVEAPPPSSQNKLPKGVVGKTITLGSRYVGNDGGGTDNTDIRISPPNPVLLDFHYMCAKLMWETGALKTMEELMKEWHKTESLRENGEGIERLNIVLTAKLVAWEGMMPDKRYMWTQGAEGEDDESPMEDDGSPMEDDGSPMEDDESPMEDDGSPMEDE
ncbi:hypothetical protein DFH27DRAFT_639223 [Peziza echinospora]|nr:hypothetical protein DFH27DRAFT_639223 [Peziza echinospora]